MATTSPLGTTQDVDAGAVAVTSRLHFPLDAAAELAHQTLAAPASEHIRLQPALPSGQRCLVWVVCDSSSFLAAGIRPTGRAWPRVYASSATPESSVSGLVSTHRLPPEIALPLPLDDGTPTDGTPTDGTPTGQVGLMRLLEAGGAWGWPWLALDIDVLDTGRSGLRLERLAWAVCRHRTPPPPARTT